MFCIETGESEKFFSNSNDLAEARTTYPGFPFCFPDDDNIPPVAAAAIFFCIRSRTKEPDAPGRAFARTKRP
jgi:hypothetical protein